MRGVLDMAEVRRIDVMPVPRADGPSFVALWFVGDDANVYVNTVDDIDRLQAALDEARTLLTASEVKSEPRHQLVRADRVEVGNTVVLDAETAQPFDVKVARIVLDDEVVIFTGADGMPYTFVRSELVTRVAPLAAVAS